MMSRDDPYPYIELTRPKTSKRNLKKIIKALKYNFLLLTLQHLKKIISFILFTKKKHPQKLRKTQIHFVFLTCSKI